MSLHEGVFMLCLRRAACKLLEMMLRSGDPGGGLKEEEP